MNTLQKILAHIGYSERPQQTALYAALQKADYDGVVAQAGTGTGKSIAVLAAAVDWHEATGEMSLVVVPTNILMDQYLTVDAPRVRAATGAHIESLKGRNRYLCESANGFSSIAVPPRGVLEVAASMKDHLYDQESYEPADTVWFGCPGSDECDKDKICHYRRQKERAQSADVVVTNSHLLIIDNQLKRAEEVSNAELAENGEEIPERDAPLIFPELGVVLVDECHVLEDSLREFATRSISYSSVEGYLLGYWIADQCRNLKEATAILGDADLAAALNELGQIEIQPGTKGVRKLREAIEAGKYILNRAKNNAYSSGSAVLYLDPAEKYTQKQDKLVSTQIDMGLAASTLLRSTPFGMVSATIPGSLRDALGIPEARFVDVGHPFDYATQAKLGVSAINGSFKAEQDKTNIAARAQEIGYHVVESCGGALLLFPSYRALEEVYKLIAGPLHLSGLTVLKQELDTDKAALGARFKHDGNAVLFGTESFATGFDAPGDALRLVSIWKLPYPGLDPVTKAISRRNYDRYKDMMLMKVAQAAGRLIRTPTDRGCVWIADSRAGSTILGTGDPMLAHFDQFGRM